MSLAGPTGRPSACSGDMKPGEPITRPVRVNVLTSAAREMPKSMTRGPSSASSTFDGLRSRCTTPAAWISTSPSASPAASASTEPAGSGPVSGRPRPPATARGRRRWPATAGGRPCRHRPAGAVNRPPPSGRRHLPREPGPEAGVVGQLGVDHLDRGQLAAGRAAEEHLAHGAAAQAPFQPVVPHRPRILGRQPLQHARSPHHRIWDASQPTGTCLAPPASTGPACRWRPAAARTRRRPGAASPEPAAAGLGAGGEADGVEQAGAAAAGGRAGRLGHRRRRAACRWRPSTISSAIPYSSGSAPATTPPVRLMCSTPGPISLAWPTIVRTVSDALLQVAGDPGRAGDPTQNR